MNKPVFTRVDSMSVLVGNRIWVFDGTEPGYNEIDKIEYSDIIHIRSTQNPTQIPSKTPTVSPINTSLTPTNIPITKPNPTLKPTKLTTNNITISRFMRP